jgi:hypothetical protein
VPPDADAAADERTLGQVLGRIEANLTPEALGTGPLAMLRRLDPGRPPTDAGLHRLLASHVDARVERDGLAAWTLIVHAMALAAPSGMRRGAGLGGPLFEADYKEGRLTRLLESAPRDLAATVPRAVRFLVARGQPLDPLALAWFVLDLRAGGERAEAQRTRVARDYYRAEYNARGTA